MKRAVIALVLALAALALLVSLALESRSLPVETHVSQYTIAGDLERFNGDFRALVDTLQGAWDQQTPPGGLLPFELPCVVDTNPGGNLDGRPADRRLHDLGGFVLRG